MSCEFPSTCSGQFAHSGAGSWARLLMLVVYCPQNPLSPLLYKRLYIWLILRTYSIPITYQLYQLFQGTLVQFQSQPMNVWFQPPKCRQAALSTMNNTKYPLASDHYLWEHSFVSMVVEIVPVKGGLGGIFYPPIGRKNTTYIPLIVLAFWGVICYLPPFTGTRNNHWLFVWSLNVGDSSHEGKLVCG